MTISRSYGRVLKQTVLIMMTMLFGVSVFGCAKNNPAPTDDTAVPASVLDDCMKQVKKYKMGKVKWLDGDGIVGMVFETGFLQDGEYIQVSSSHMPDNGTKAFDAIEKILSKAWSS